jgi:cell division protein FtsL
MIAHQLPVQETPRLRIGTRSARTASELRRGRVRRSRYADVMRIAIFAAIATIVGLGYLLLVANITRMHYEASRAQAQRAALQEETQRLDDEIARLSSRERLAVLATQLGMKESAAFSVVQLPQPVVARSGRLPILSSIAGWGR